VAGRPPVCGDGLAFAAVVGFGISLYASIAHLIPALEPLRPALLTAGLGAGALVFGRVAGRRPIKLDGLRGGALVALCVWASLSIRWSHNPEATRHEAIELVKLCAIYLTLVNVVSGSRRLALLSGAMVLASLAPSIGAVDRWREGVDLLDGYRARWLGVYADPNHLAMSLAAVVPVALAFAVGARRSLPIRLVALAAAGLAIAAIVLSHSRGGTLGLALALGLWTLTGARRFRAFVVTVGVAIALGLYAPQSFWSRTETIAEYEEDVAAQGRIWAWEVAAAVHKDRPLTGVGAGAFRDAWPSYAPPQARGTSFVAHNIFLAALGEMGLVGFLLLIAFVAKALSGAAAARSDPEIGPLARALAAGFSGYILCAMVSGYVLSAHLFFLAGLAASCEGIVRQREKSAAACGAVPVLTGARS